MNGRNSGGGEVYRDAAALKRPNPLAAQGVKNLSVIHEARAVSSGNLASRQPLSNIDPADSCDTRSLQLPPENALTSWSLSGMGAASTHRVYASLPVA